MKYGKTRYYVVPVTVNGERGFAEIITEERYNRGWTHIKPLFTSYSEIKCKEYVLMSGLELRDFSDVTMVDNDLCHDC
jgi:hypothetical protein